MCRLASGWGYDGLEIACWGDHLDVERAAEDDAYVQERLGLLDKHGLKVFAISNHLNGQAVCDDPIDERHKGILHPRGLGRRRPRGRPAAGRRGDEADRPGGGASSASTSVVGFTGSKIWKTVAMFPPVPESMIEDGYADFADRWNPILDVFDEVGRAVRARGAPVGDRLRLLDDGAHAGGHRPPRGLRAELGPEPLRLAGPRPGRLHLGLQGPDLPRRLQGREAQVGNGRNGRMGSHLPWADPRRGWDFVSTGHGDVPWEACFRMLNTIGYDGPISVEWEDAGMDRLVGAPEALEFASARLGVRRRLLQRQLTVTGRSGCAGVPPTRPGARGGQGRQRNQDDDRPRARPRTSPTRARPWSSP